MGGIFKIKLKRRANFVYFSSDFFPKLSPIQLVYLAREILFKFNNFCQTFSIIPLLIYSLEIALLSLLFLG